MKIQIDDTKKDIILPLVPYALHGSANTTNCITLLHGDKQLATGIYLLDASTNEELFQVLHYKEILIGEHLFSFPLVKALKSIKKGEYKLTFLRKGYSLACITLSDKGSVGEREDTSGVTIRKVLEKKIDISMTSHFILPDNPYRLKALALNLAYERQYDLIITTGGTGIAPSDLTPEALLPLLTRRFDGFEYVMMQKSLEKTVNAPISRSFVGTIDKTMVISLPGSPKAVRENITAIIPSLPHALIKLHGNTDDCADM